MKAKVGALFQALHVLESLRRKEIERRAHADAGVEGVSHTPVTCYGANLVACDILARALESCEFEIELPASADTVLVPLFQDQLLKEMAASIATR